MEKEKAIQESVKTQFVIIEKWLENYKNVFDLVFLGAENINELPQSGDLCTNTYNS